MGLFGLYTKDDVIAVSSAVAEAAGTTLETVVNTISSAKDVLEKEVETTLKTADIDEVNAQDAYKKAVATAVQDLDTATAKVGELRQVAAEKSAKVASKMRAVKLLTK